MKKLKKLPKHTHITKETPLRTTQVRAETTSQFIDLDQLLDGLFQGTTGLTKFVNNFFQGSEGLAKFVDNFLTGAKIALLAITTGHIQDLAITNAKIGNLAVDTAKIANLAVETAKIADAAINNAKIQNAAITNLKILSGTIDFNRCDTEFGKYSFFQHDRWIVSAESLTGYTVDKEGDGNVLCRKNYLKALTSTTTASMARIKTYPTLDLSRNPEFKCRAKFEVSGDGSMEWYVGIGQEGTAKFFGFRVVYSGSGSVYNLKGVWCNGGSEHSTSLMTISSGDMKVLKAVHDGSTIKFYVDGELKGTASSDIPTSGMLEDFCAYVYNTTTYNNIIIEVWHFSASEDWM